MWVVRHCNGEHVKTNSKIQSSRDDDTKLVEMDRKTTGCAAKIHTSTGGRREVPCVRAQGALFTRCIFAEIGRTCVRWSVPTREPTLEMSSPPSTLELCLIFYVNMWRAETSLRGVIVLGGTIRPRPGMGRTSLAGPGSACTP